MTKEAPALTAVLVGLGWDVWTTVGTDFDLDASALLLNVEGKVGSDFDLDTEGQVGSDQNLVFLNNLKSPEGSVLHGGEPLLVCPARLRDICQELTRTLSPLTTLDLRMHTNAVTLDRRHLEICREFGVQVSVSLDGDRAANDRHRRDRRGRSSYDRVVRGIRLLQEPEYRHLFSGVLCTVDVANDPVVVHDALTGLAPPRIDYLIPHSTWDSPPPNPSGGGTPYADWLLAVFDRWEQQGRPMPVRTFDSVLSTLRGGPPLTEAMGLAPSDLAVIETDGTFEQAEWLKTAYAGAPETGYDVFRHGFSEFVAHPGVQARQTGVDGISDTCRRCPVVAKGRRRHHTLRQLVLKIHSRCDLLCEHCYVYQHADQSWRSRLTLLVQGRHRTDDGAGQHSVDSRCKRPSSRATETLHHAWNGTTLRLPVRRHVLGSAGL
ncbi:FxsB family radical SAM/SPASM domain protein [Streptomyces adustus]|uniref:FxsB family radical SAM/SPASM domain protein n=1 Tax=Streptomyces adustus TaxID=1609272 RepID=A0A5N8VSL5_9ACTN|nr:FxsB family radical SAM/SPASM domain protein [Streptomyces adustus]